MSTTLALLVVLFAGCRDEAKVAGDTAGLSTPSGSWKVVSIEVS